MCTTVRIVTLVIQGVRLINIKYCKMRKIIFYIIFFLFFVLNKTLAESIQLSGKVTYVSAKHVYVRFDQTNGIATGDTLFQAKNQQYLPVLVVKSLSSISCMGEVIEDFKLIKGDEIIAIVKLSVDKKQDKQDDVPIEVKAEKQSGALAVNDLLLKNEKNKLKELNEKTDVNGRISVSSYTNLSSDLFNYQRLKYNLSLSTGNIASSKISTDMYLSYNQKITDKIPYQHDLKVYSLAMIYQLNDKSKFTLGRKLNPGMANVGAVDGLQFESKKGNFSYGALIGSRPDINTYGVDLKLMQMGAFSTHQLQKGKMNFQTTIAVFNQLNQWNTDRRFIYLQHSNQLSDEFSMFGSVEMDLYALENGLPKNTFDFTGGFLSLRYRPSQKISMSVNYDSRKNIYYYETYKNFADSLFDKETRQGLRYSFMYKPVKNIIWNSYVGYRLPNKVDQASLNGNTSLTYNEIPVIGGSFTLRAMGLQTGYVDGKILGGEYQHDFKNGIHSLSFEYQYVDYLMKSNQTHLLQQIVELSMNWRLSKKWMISVNEETTFDEMNQMNFRLFMNLTRRF